MRPGPARAVRATAAGETGSSGGALARREPVAHDSAVTVAAAGIRSRCAAIRLSRRPPDRTQEHPRGRLWRRQ